MPVDVYPGETWLLWGNYRGDLITLTANPAALVDAAVLIGFGTSRRQPATWEAPADIDTTGAGYDPALPDSGVIRAAIGDWEDRIAGNYWLWVKVTTADGVVDIAPATNIRIHILETDAV